MEKEWCPGNQRAWAACPLEMELVSQLVTLAHVFADIVTQRCVAREMLVLAIAVKKVCTRRGWFTGWRGLVVCDAILQGKPMENTAD